MRYIIPLFAAMLAVSGVSHAETPTGPLLLQGPMEQVDCISPEQYAEMNRRIAEYDARPSRNRLERLENLEVIPVVRPKRYRFYPMAGNWEQDLIPGNFVDLDDGSGIRTYNCATYSYNGHNGHDIGPLLRSFEKMDARVPIFAAMDGKVIDVHDGEYDRNTSCTGNANYVVIDHGDGHRSIYYHFMKNSITVSKDQQVRAGQQIGLMGSSGCSSRPHLHFETRWNGTVFEPFSGLCRLGQSGWVEQPPLRSDTFVTEVDVLDNGSPDGTFVLGNRLVRVQASMRNLPANSNYRLRVIRPDLSTAYESPVKTFSNNTSEWPLSYWTFSAGTVNLNATGTWFIFLHINGTLEMSAPFTVVSTAGQEVNRAPEAVTLEFDPPQPRRDDVVFCRITDPFLYRDKDYDIVRYRYVWRIAGTVVRDITHAGLADALAHSMGDVGDTLTCTVTPTDGAASAPSKSVAAVLGYPLGDVSGSGNLTAFDVTLALRIAGGLEAGTAQEVERGDLNNGGRLDLADALRILRRLEGLY